MHPIAGQPSPSLQFFRARALAARWNVNLTTIWRMTKRGDLPTPTRLSPGIVAWRSDVIEAIEAARTGESDAAARRG
jgi:predicted DNA-binding transcriptional regulator AlpA